MKNVPLIVRRYGRLLRLRRSEKQITLREFGERSGIKRSKLSEIETGKTIPNLVDMQAIARILGNDMGWAPPIVSIPRQEEQNAP